MVQLPARRSIGAPVIERGDSGDGKQFSAATAGRRSSQTGSPASTAQPGLRPAVPRGRRRHRGSGYLAGHRAGRAVGDPDRVQLRAGRGRPVCLGRLPAPGRPADRPAALDLAAVRLRDPVLGHGPGRLAVPRVVRRRRGALPVARRHRLLRHGPADLDRSAARAGRSADDGQPGPYRPRRADDRQLARAGQLGDRARAADRRRRRQRRSPCSSASGTRWATSSS